MLRRGDVVGVRFVTDVYPGKVTKVTLSKALVRLMKTKPDGQPDLHSNAGEALISFRASDEVVLGDRTERGVWRQNPFEASSSRDLVGIVYNWKPVNRAEAV